MSAKLCLNIARIQVPDTLVPASVFPYSDAKLAELRSRHRDSHSFKRIGEGKIVAVPIASSVPHIGGEPQQLRLSEEPGLVTTLAKDALLRFAAELGKPSPSYNPIAIPGGKRYLDKDVVGLDVPEWLSIRARFLASTRFLKSSGSLLIPCLVLDVDMRRSIGLTCSELVELGFDIDGLYVGRRYPVDDDARLAPRFSALGKCVEVVGEEIILTDTRTDATRIRLDEAYIDPSPTAFNKCLAFATDEQYGSVQAAIERKLALERNGKRKLEKLREAARKLSERQLELVPGVPLTLSDFLDSQSIGFPQPREAAGPVYIFNADQSRTDRNNRAGIDNHGPFSREGFTPTRPLICVICEKQFRGQVEQHLHKFREGISLPGATLNPFAKGFSRTYHLDGFDLRFYEADDDTAGSYRRAALKAVEGSTPQRPWDLAFVQTRLQSKEQVGNANPYLVAKAALLTNGIPVQNFVIDKVGFRPYDLSYILADFALGTYTKLGGTPWLLRADRAIAHELVIGLGSAMVGASRFSTRERMVGITSVFSGDGNYILSNLSAAVPYDDYRNAVLESLRLSVQRARETMGWQTGDAVRIIFHAFKPVKDAEAEAVKELLTELAEFEVKFAFVHVQDHHSLMLFDELQPGIKDRASHVNKGEFAPRRGTFFHVSHYETLISLTGPRELRDASHGTPQPILLSLHRASTFNDMTYLARQVFVFASHSWRSFSPAPLPVTILYSDLVAGLLGRLAMVDKWNPDVLIGKLGRTRWFL